MKSYYRSRTDSNQGEIVKALRAVGCSVQDLSAVGEGCPDLLVGINGKDYLLECKSISGKLTSWQAIWHSQWNGRKCAVVRDVKEALAAIGAEAQ